MFLFRWLKRLFFWGIFVWLVWWVTHAKIEGKPLYQAAKDMWRSESLSQGLKDARMLLGGFLRSLGEEIQEDVTEEDRKELESIIQKKIKEGDHGNPSR